MPIITLTTDFGLKDPYVGSIKGKLLSELTSAQIVDISHQIEKFGIQEAAFVLRESYVHFPANTIHIIGIKTDLTDNSKFLVVEYNQQYFIGADNGLFSLLFDDEPTKIYEIITDANAHLSFVVKDIFVAVAKRIAEGNAFETFTNPRDYILKFLPFTPHTTYNSIIGKVIYIDSYLNGITNIDKKLFDTFGKGRKFTIDLRKNNQVRKLSTSYTEVPEGELLALFNSSGLLEIAIRDAKATDLLGLKFNDVINITFQ